MISVVAGARQPLTHPGQDRQDRSGRGLPHATVPAAPTGAGVEIVVNADAGRSSAALAQYLGEALPDAVVRGCLAGDFARTVAAAASRCRILGVAGGDGSASLAAAHAWDHRLPLLVLPAGRENRFAGTLGLDSVDRALSALRTGTAALVDIACADDQVFLGTCRTDTSESLVKASSAANAGILGSLRAARGLLRTMDELEPQDVVLEDRPRRLWFLGAAIGASALTSADGLIGVRVVDAERPFGRLRAAVALLFGDPVGGRFYERFTVRALDLHARAEGLNLVLDGEVRLRRERVVLRTIRCALAVYRCP